VCPPDRPRLDYEVASFDIKHYSSRDVAPSRQEGGAALYWIRKGISCSVRRTPEAGRLGCGTARTHSDIHLLQGGAYATRNRTMVNENGTLGQLTINSVDVAGNMTGALA
jgi:hypothetical protein